MSEYPQQQQSRHHRQGNALPAVKCKRYGGISISTASGSAAATTTGQYAGENSSDSKPEGPVLSSAQDTTPPTKPEEPKPRMTKFNVASILEEPRPGPGPGPGPELEWQHGVSYIPPWDPRGDLRNVDYEAQLARRLEELETNAKIRRHYRKEFHKSHKSHAEGFQMGDPTKKADTHTRARTRTRTLSKNNKRHVVTTDKLRGMVEEQVEYEVDCMVEDLKEYDWLVFERPLPEVGTAAPCLQCALKGMRCSSQLVRNDHDVVCGRCERNGEDFCIRQKRDLTATQRFRASKLYLGRLARRGDGGGWIFDDRHDDIKDYFRQGYTGLERWVRNSMVYCLDGDVPQVQVLRKASKMLDGRGVNVCGTMVSPMDARRFALPRWHDNDKPENRARGELLMTRPADYFAEYRRQVRGPLEEGDEEAQDMMKRQKQWVDEALAMGESPFSYIQEKRAEYEEELRAQQEEEEKREGGRLS